MENRIIALNGSLSEDNLTVRSKTGYRPSPKTAGGISIMPILFSLFLVFGGLSGRFVLRGTNSSRALVFVGLAFLAWDIISIFRQKAEREKAEAEYSVRFTKVTAEEKAVEADKRQLPSFVNVRVLYDKSLGILDITPRLNGRNMTQNGKENMFTGSTAQVKNIISIVSLDLSAVFEVSSGSGEVVIRLFRDKTGFGITLGEDTAYPAA